MKIPWRQPGRTMRRKDDMKSEPSPVVGYDVPRPQGGGHDPEDVDDELNDILERLRTLDQLSRSQLTGRLARSLMQAQDEALAELSEAQKEMERQEEMQRQGLEILESSGLDRAGFLRPILRTMAISFVVTILALLALFLLPIFIGLLLFVVALAGSLMMTVMVLLNNSRARIQDRYRSERIADDIPVRRQHAANEFRRLSSLYVQYLYWVEIVSEALHRPWGDEEDNRLLSPRDRPSGREPDDAGLADLTPTTLSLVVGRTVIPGRNHDLVKLRIARNAVDPGWMKRALDIRSDAWQAEYRPIAEAMAMNIEKSIEPEEDADARSDVLYEMSDSDSSSSREIRYPLADFANRYCGGHFGVAAVEEFWEELKTLIDSERIVAMVEGVETQAQGLETDSLASFLVGPLNLPSGSVFEKDEYVDPLLLRQGLNHSTWVGISPSVGACPVDTEAPKVVQYPLVEAGVDLFASFRMEVSDPIDVKLCRLIAPESATPVVRPSSSDTKRSTPRRRG